MAEIFPLTQPNGSIIYTTPQAIVQKQKEYFASTGLANSTLNDMIRNGTREEITDLLDATIEYMKGLKDVTLWYEDPNDKARLFEDDNRLYSVKQEDNTYKELTVDEVIGDMIGGWYDSLEIQGSIQEQRIFFRALRRRIQKEVQVIKGDDITEEGAVQFGDNHATIRARNVEERITDMEEIFERMVLGKDQTLDERLEEMKIDDPEESVINDGDKMDLD